MLLGVLDGDSKTVWESRERSAGETEDDLVELLVREVEEARAERPGVEAIGLGIPATIDHEKGLAISAVNLPIDDLPIRDLVGRADRPADLRRQRRQRRGAGRAPLRCRPRHQERGDADDRHRDRRRPDPRRRDLPRRDRRRRRARSHGDRDGRPPLPGQLPQPRLRRDLRLRHGARPRRPGGGRKRARLRPRRAARRGRGGRRQGGHRRRPGRRRDGDRGLRPGRQPPRRRPGQLRQHLRAGRDRRRRRRDRRRRPAARARAPRAAKRGRCGR